MSARSAPASVRIPLPRTRRAHKTTDICGFVTGGSSSCVSLFPCVRACVSVWGHLWVCPAVPAGPPSPAPVRVRACAHICVCVRARPPRASPSRFSPSPPSPLPPPPLLLPLPPHLLYPPLPPNSSPPPLSPRPALLPPAPLSSFLSCWGLRAEAMGPGSEGQLLIWYIIC